MTAIHSYKPWDTNSKIADILAVPAKLADKAQPALSVIKFVQSIVRGLMVVGKRAPSLPLPPLKPLDGVLDGGKVILTMGEVFGKDKEVFERDLTTGTNVWAKADLQKKGKVGFGAAASSLEFVGALDKVKLIDLGAQAAKVGQSVSFLSWLTIVPLSLAVDALKMFSTLFSIGEKTTVLSAINAKKDKQNQRAKIYKPEDDASVKDTRAAAIQARVQEKQKVLPFDGEVLFETSKKEGNGNVFVRGTYVLSKDDKGNIQAREATAQEIKNRKEFPRLVETGKYIIGLDGKKTKTNIFNCKVEDNGDTGAVSVNYEEVGDRLERLRSYAANTKIDPSNPEKNRAPLVELAAHAEVKAHKWKQILKHRSHWWSFFYRTDASYEAKIKAEKWKKKSSYFGKLVKERRRIVDAVKQTQASHKTEPNAEKKEVLKSVHHDKVTLKRMNAFIKESNKISDYYRGKASALEQKELRRAKLAEADCSDKAYETLRAKKYERIEQKQAVLDYDIKKNRIGLIFDIAKAIIIGVGIAFGVAAILAASPAIAAAAVSLGVVATVLGIIGEFREEIFAVLGLFVSTIGMGKTIFDEFSEKPKVSGYAPMAATAA